MQCRQDEDSVASKMDSSQIRRLLLENKKRREMQGDAENLTPQIATTQIHQQINVVNHHHQMQIAQAYVKQYNLSLKWKTVLQTSLLLGALAALFAAYQQLQVQPQAAQCNTAAPALGQTSELQLGSNAYPSQREQHCQPTKLQIANGKVNPATTFAQQPSVKRTPKSEHRKKNSYQRAHR